MLESEHEFSLAHPNGEIVRGYFQDRSLSPAGVFLPGFASDLRGSKSRLMAVHAEHRGRSWLRFDYRGMGLSDGEMAQFTLTRYLDDLGLVLDMLSPLPVVLVGSSMGGWVATLAAQRWPDRIASLLLIAPAYNFIQEYFHALPEMEQESWQKEGVRTWQLGNAGPSFRMEFAAVTDSLQYDLLDQPPQLSIPVHILHGSADEAVPSGRSLAFAAKARARPLSIRILPGANHRLEGEGAALLQAVEHVWPAAPDLAVDRPLQPLTVHS